ncbi:aldehyde dehydrogenase family protein [Streptomyces umbrinus]|uniref:aldehyde dehydrogenase family protein n=1 Tax=Streptomyces umbrinus TaxID=67370 RepID=UPI00167EFE65|nr:hypothetical protein GCM10018775_79220 [Streptomyces umbrinus]
MRGKSPQIVAADLAQAAFRNRPELHQDSGGWFVARAVIDNVSPAMAVARDEAFGPVVTVPAFDADEKALAARRSRRHRLRAGRHRLVPRHRPGPHAGPRCPGRYRRGQWT